jgi:predicted acyltransferase
MATATSKLPERARAIAPVDSSRLMSLDVFRGVTIAGMILVNDPGDGPSSYWPLRHAAWNGWTPTDLVFPFFLFIVGTAMAFSFTSRLERGERPLHLLRHALWRGLILFALGLLLHGFPNRYNPAHMRVYGVLQRIALVYVITATLELWTGWRAQVAILIACLAGYWMMMRYVPVPGFGIPTHGFPILDPDRNLVAWLDRKLLMGHLYEGTRDPEGLLSTIPASATCLAGLLTGKWLRGPRAPGVKALWMIASGAFALALGRTLDLWFPINKKLWTSSYVMFTAGLALMGLALCYWLVDIQQHRSWWTKGLLVFGKNAIAAYVFSEALASLLYTIRVHPQQGGAETLQELVYSRIFSGMAGPANASLLYAVTYVGICWLAMAVLYRKGMFLRV